jgi:predicted ABC-type ATPase
VLVYVSVRIPELNIARVSNRFLQGGHDVPVERIVARRQRSHELFAWFANEADQVFVFDNSMTAPTIAAVKSDGQWAMPALGMLAPDLVSTIVVLASG